MTDWSQFVAYSCRNRYCQDNCINRVDSLTSASHAPTQSRAVTGLVGYVAFVALLGLNLGLLGIAFDPLAWELIIDL